MAFACKGKPKVSEVEEHKENRPNIVFILVDDLVYSDVGYMGYQNNINTPNIDKLARIGRC
ncbi:hypothetical protein [Flagellimonas eckloniae]|uniref:hypothetical protein n=1 Tax=Flagellimonas eckloniae TaxID=346185 RepID=UPI0011125647|nr:hypothetical protein [Allomuricauda eckloniae]